MNKTIKSEIGGFDSVVIVKDNCDIPCGVALDVTNYTGNVICAGHLLAKNDESKEVFPLNISNGSYEALPSGCSYFGIVKSSVLKSLAACAILVDGVVNAAAAARLIGAAYPKAALEAIGQIRFLYWGEGSAPSGGLKVIQVSSDQLEDLVYMARATSKHAPLYEGFEGVWVFDGYIYTVKRDPEVGDDVYHFDNNGQSRIVGRVSSVAQVELILAKYPNEDESYVAVRINMEKNPGPDGAPEAYGWYVEGEVIFTTNAEPNAGDKIWYINEDTAEWEEDESVVSEYVPGPRVDMGPQ